MNDETDNTPRRREPHDSGGGGDHGPPPLAILVILVTIGVACVGGYLLLMKLIDMSRQEDCMMSGRRNCDPIEMPVRR